MDHPHDTAFYDDLDATLAEAWRRLARATADRRSGFRTLQLASIAADGPRVRTVVLRGAEAGSRRLRFHTDDRSAKVDELTAHPAVEICAYDAAAKMQLRLRGSARLHRTDPVADAAWAATAPYSRVCYRAPIAPGAAIAAPAIADPGEAQQNPANPDAGRGAFVAVTIEVTRLEWLYLAARGHRRAVFVWDGADWHGEWLAP